ncbi:hypothetical protein DLE01_17810, partial [Streptomyces sp. FT05W]
MPPRTDETAAPADTPTADRAALRIAVLADSDTRWKWGALTARRLSGAPESGTAERPVERIDVVYAGRLAEIGA